MVLARFSRRRRAASGLRTISLPAAAVTTRTFFFAGGFLAASDSLNEALTCTKVPLAAPVLRAVRRRCCLNASFL